MNHRKFNSTQINMLMRTRYSMRSASGCEHNRATINACGTTTHARVSCACCVCVLCLLTFWRRLAPRINTPIRYYCEIFARKTHALRRCVSRAMIINHFWQLCRHCGGSPMWSSSSSARVLNECSPLLVINDFNVVRAGMRCMNSMANVRS